MVRMPHWPKPFWYVNNIEFGFDRIIPLLEKLGNPHEKLPPIIHVAGTNGKGSTVAFIKSILEHSGFKVHCYTSPHLVRFNERIVINGKEISDEYLYQIIEKTRIAAEGLEIQTTFFEATTATAFLAFSENHADFLIMETGMGGRLDATNIAKGKIISIITPIAYDHMEFLGDSLYKIATEKSGIIEKGIPCIASLQHDEAFAAIEARCKELESELIAYGYDFAIEPSENGFIYKSDMGEKEFPNPSLAGDHQLINAATAITSIYKLNLGIKDEIIQKAITNTYWKARLEKITSGYLFNQIPKGWEIWIDGAHNASGAQALGVWAEENKDMPLYVICGMTRNRDVELFLSFLKPNIAFLCGIYVDDEPASYSAEKISAFAKNIGINSAPIGNFEEGFELFYNHNKETKARILICGSLFLAGMFLRLNETA